MRITRETAEHLASISRSLNEPIQALMGHAALAFPLQHQGELVASRQEFEEALRYHDPTQVRRYLELYKLEPGIQTQAEMVRTLWLLGFPDQARRQMEQALASARALCIPITLAFCQRSAAMLYQNLRQPDEAKEIGQECSALCEEHGIMLERGWVECPLGWAIAELGQIEEGISLIRKGLDAQLSIGSESARPQCLAVLAGTLWLAGQIEQAMNAAEEGLGVSARNEEWYYDAELWRLKGELLKMQGKATEAEACFQRAIEIARQQAAKSFELRACTSLARLWQKNGKRTEAQRLLSETYSWFTEGFETADLQEAASLLEELS